VVSGSTRPRLRSDRVVPDLFSGPQSASTQRRLVFLQTPGRPPATPTKFPDRHSEPAVRPRVLPRSPAVDRRRVDFVSPDLHRVTPSDVNPSSNQQTEGSTCSFSRPAGFHLLLAGLCLWSTSVHPSVVSDHQALTSSFPSCLDQLTSSDFHLPDLRFALFRPPSVGTRLWLSQNPLSPSRRVLYRFPPPAYHPSFLCSAVSTAVAASQLWITPATVPAPVEPNPWQQSTTTVVPARLAPYFKLCDGTFLFD
jgi:hypothetical protein